MAEWDCAAAARLSHFYCPLRGLSLSTFAPTVGPKIAQKAVQGTSKALTGCVKLVDQVFLFTYLLKAGEHNFFTPY